MLLFLSINSLKRMYKSNKAEGCYNSYVILVLDKEVDQIVS